MQSLGSHASQPASGNATPMDVRKVGFYDILRDVTSPAQGRTPWLVPWAAGLL